MAGAKAPAVFFGARPSAASPGGATGDAIGAWLRSRFFVSSAGDQFGGGGEPSDDRYPEPCTSLAPATIVEMGGVERKVMRSG
jgi:hypothetical protein